MIIKLKIYFIIVFTIIFFCGIDYSLRCACSELEESAFIEDETGDHETGIITQKSFRSLMKKECEHGGHDSKDIPIKENNQNEASRSDDSKEGENFEEGYKDEVKKEENVTDSVSEREMIPPDTSSDDQKDEEDDEGDSKNRDKNEEQNKYEEDNDSIKDVNSEKGKLDDETISERSKTQHDNINAEDDSKNNDGYKPEVDGEKEIKNELEMTKHVNKTVELKDYENDSSVENIESEGQTGSELLKEETASESKTLNIKTSENNLDGNNNTNSVNHEAYSSLNNDNKESEIEDKSGKLNDDIEMVVKEMKEELASKPSNNTILERIDNNYIITIKKLDSADSMKEEDTELNTNTKEARIRIHKDENKDNEQKNKVNTITKTQSELNERDISDTNEHKSNKELIEKLKSLSSGSPLTDEGERGKNNSLNEKNNDEKMEALIKEKKDYDTKKMEKKNEPLQKKKKWYERRDPVTGELLFDAAALSRNITAAITAKRKKGSFSKCFHLHGQKEKCESTKNCFYDNVYDMCLLDCSLLNKKDACEEYLECRFDYVVPRKACVNDCFQSRNFMKQDLNGVMRGCMWCSQEIMCNTIKKIQGEKFPDFNNRKFDCNWQVQNGLDGNDENTENSICVDKNFGRNMTNKDLVAANYISTQTKLTNEAAEKIKQQMLSDGESEEAAKLQTQNINILKRSICYPPNIPFSKLTPEKNYYINDEEIEIVCDYGYKITGASDKLKCVNGEFSPKAFCIAYKEIEKQKESIGKHFNNIFNLLVNSVLGGGGWIDFGIEKINESRSENRDEQEPDLGGDRSLELNITDVLDNKINFKDGEVEGDLTTNATNSNKTLLDIEHSKLEEKKEIVNEDNEKQSDSAGINSGRIILDRVTGNTILSVGNS
ncbi:hypothetical protein FG379_001703 [Cryptosporidium bovis]|uniref:uncharacterized protein n=1 Tax=Cryptosporidium bovis TaxID=310047 RepID=UPI00351A489F|nr:hypothetical protein FG379_001703 [Cryptosporidium bovis]